MNRPRDKARYNETVLILLIQLSDEQTHVAIIKWSRSSIGVSGLGLVLSEYLGRYLGTYLGGRCVYESILFLALFSLSCTVLLRIHVARSHFMLESANIHVIGCWK